jgi:hypothetical protein
MELNQDAVALRLGFLRFLVRHVRRYATLLVLTSIAACRDASAPVADSRPGLLGEVRTGYIIGRNGQPTKVTYEIRGGLAIFEGDMVLGPAAEIAATVEELTSRPMPKRPNLGVAIDGAQYKWIDPNEPVNGTVYYVIDPALPDRARITNAIAMIEQSAAGVYFYPGTGRGDYLQFVPSTVCNSFVGRQGGEQIINLATGCNAGAAAHEILHALGLWHEQSRCDRDSYVAVLWGNIQVGQEHNFNRVCDNATDYLSYDEGSVMHYGAYAFSRNGQPTLRSLRGRDSFMGQRNGPNASDVATVQKIYFGDRPVPLACRPRVPGGPCSVLEDPTYERIRAIGSSIGGFGPYGGFEGDPIAFTAGTAQPDLIYSWYFGQGDGSIDAMTAFTYADNGVYPILLTIEDLEGGRASVSAEATVVNAIPVVSAGPDATIVSGQSLALTGSFTDAGVNDAPWTYSINWGAGEPTTGSGIPAVAIAVTRRYLTAGTYTVALSVTDKDGGTGTGSLKLSVARLSASIDILPDLKTRGQPSEIDLSGRGGTLPVAVISEDAFDARLVDAATATLGDGVGADTPVARDKRGAPRFALTDVDGDGDMDVVFHFDRAALLVAGDVKATTTHLVFKSDLKDGRQVQGVDAVRVVP